MLLDYFSFRYAPSRSRIATTENEMRHCARACLRQECRGHALQMWLSLCRYIKSLTYAWETVTYELKYEWTTVQWWNNGQVWKNVAQTSLDAEFWACYAIVQPDGWQKRRSTRVFLSLLRNYVRRKFNTDSLSSADFKFQSPFHKHVTTRLFEILWSLFFPIGNKITSKARFAIPLSEPKNFFSSGWSFN